MYTGILTACKHTNQESMSLMNVFNHYWHRFLNFFSKIVISILSAGSSVLYTGKSSHLYDFIDDGRWVSLLTTSVATWVGWSTSKKKNNNEVLFKTVWCFHNTYILINLSCVLVLKMKVDVIFAFSLLFDLISWHFVDADLIIFM